jgi:hypothetical protein
VVPQAISSGLAEDTHRASDLHEMATRLDGKDRGQQGLPSLSFSKRRAGH